VEVILDIEGAGETVRKLKKCQLFSFWNLTRKKSFKIETALHIQALMIAPKRCIFGEVCLLRSYHELLCVHVLPSFFYKKFSNIRNPVDFYLFSQSLMTLKATLNVARDF